MLARMKKLALALLASASLISPALACPDGDHDSGHSSAPKTAEKSKDQKGTEPAKKDDAKAKDANKDQKPVSTDSAAKTKEGEKKPDKVSSAK